MASGVVYDSVLFNMKFGEQRQDFFQKCWQLNQKGIVTNGPGSQTVKYQFYFNAWSIWNKKLQADKLVPVVMDTLKKWYPGNDFIKVPLKKDSTQIFVKIDGNRRITIKPLDDNRIVKAKIDDLRYVLDEK